MNPDSRVLVFSGLLAYVDSPRRSLRCVHPLVSIISLPLAGRDWLSRRFAEMLSL